MRFMTDDQEKILDMLVDLAEGNFSLVEDALHNANPQGAPDLREVVDYIRSRVEEAREGLEKAVRQKVA